MYRVITTIKLNPASYFIMINMQVQLFDHWPQTTITSPTWCTEQN